MRLRVEGHRSRAALGLQSLKECQFVRTFFPRNCRCSIAARCEQELHRIIEGAAIDPGADRNSGDNLSGFSIEHRHHFVVTAREQPMMLRVEGDAARTFSRSKRPVRNDCVFARINNRDLAFIFDVAVNAPCFLIYRREFGGSFKLDRR